jgi:hypothetical protein
MPMGGDLRKALKGSAPGFLVQALRDPDGANLDRVQVIKGWIDAKEKTHERIYDIAVSGDRKIGKDGRAREPVGSTVDIKKATFTNMIGAAALNGFWKDPDFDPAEDAFYYVRVIEIPKPRWTTRDAAFFGIPLPERVPPHRAGPRIHLTDLVHAKIVNTSVHILDRWPGLRRVCYFYRMSPSGCHFNRSMQHMH